MLSPYLFRCGAATSGNGECRHGESLKLPPTNVASFCKGKCAKTLRHKFVTGSVPVAQRHRPPAAVTRLTLLAAKLSTMTLLVAVAIAFFALFGDPVHAFISTATNLIQRNSLILSIKKHPFVVSGETLLSLEDDALKSPAQALIDAGNAWTSNWEDVTYACSDAAEEFRKVNGYEKIADELKDLSEIGGCTSVGPASSVPNLLELQLHFDALAKKTGSTEFKVISDAFGELAQEYS